MLTPMSDSSFTSNELAVIKTFIKRKYPQAIRSINAVVRETGLTLDVVADIFQKYNMQWFAHIGDGHFTFNINEFTALFGRKLLGLYSDYDPDAVMAYITKCEQLIKKPVVAVVLPCVDEDTEISAAELVFTVDPAMLASGLAAAVADTH